MLRIKHKDIEFSVGDIVAVHQKLADRIQVFEGQVIAISPRVCDILESYQQDKYCYDKSLVDQHVVMSPEGNLVPVK